MNLSFPRQVGYASGNLGKSLLWTSLELLLLFYLTEIGGIHPVFAGLAILVSLVWDGLINPVIGYWLDRRSAKGKDYRPLLFWGPPFAAILFCAILLVPLVSSHLRGFALVLVLLLFRTAYAVLDVPHNALLAQMVLTKTVRTRLAATRFFFSSIGGLTISLLVAPVIVQQDRQTVIVQVATLAAAAGVILVFSVWQSLVPARIASLARFTERAVPVKPWRFVKNIFGNPAVILYLGTAGTYAATAPLFAKTLPFLLRYVADDAELLPAALAALTTGQIIAMPTWTLLANRIGRYRVAVLCMGGLICAAAAFYASLSLDPAYTLIATGCCGLFNGGMILVIWSLAGDVAESIAETSGIRADAGLLAFLTMVQKCAIGVAAMIAGLSLHLGGFVSGSTQTQVAQDAILLTALGIPALGATGCAFLIAQLRRHLNPAI